MSKGGYAIKMAAKNGIFGTGRRSMCGGGC